MYKHETQTVKITITTLTHNTFTKNIKIPITVDGLTFENKRGSNTTKMFKIESKK